MLLPASLTATPFFALVLYAAAFAAAAGVIRFVPAAAKLAALDRGERYGSIDALRGYLALGVFVNHAVVTLFYLQHGQWEAPPVKLYIQLGHSSVVLFFMITAFLFWGRLIDSGASLDWRKLALSRLFRLYPLYLVVMASVLAVVFAAAGGSLRTPWPELLDGVTRWMFFAHPDLNAFPDTKMLIASVNWTLRYELLFYAALPLWALLFFRSRGWVAALGSLVAIVTIVVMHESAFKPSVLVSFLGGIAAAHWVRNPALRARACSVPAGWLALAALLIVMLFVKNAYKIYPVALLTVFFVVVASGHTLFGALRSRAAIWLGEVSYSVYLLHGLLLWLVVQQWADGAMHLGLEALALMMPLLAMLLVGVSSLTYLVIERRGIEAGRRLVHGRLSETRDEKKERTV